ncbi:N-acetylmuramoyl-L-alanine amidase family protein [Arenibacter arenosicollis]|nr:N-acetylmuramoyl-L-alanine amidase [Arenibacter arenosicollis]
MYLIFGQGGTTKKILVIDPGHGGKDSGAVGVNKVLEKEVVLNIAHEIQNLNHSILDNEFDIYMTRNTDTLISLRDRSRLAASIKCDLFVSLHCNAAKTNARGMEIYYPNKENPNIEVAQHLANSILEEIIQELGITERGVKLANFQVLRETIGFCPSILIETGFVTNLDEVEYYGQPKSIRAIAMAILLGIYNHFKEQ